MAWSIAESWAASTEVVAAAYEVSLDDIRAPSRGRGARPPKAVWEAKRMAVHLTVIACGCEYAALARHIGLHKDTVSTHVAKARDRQGDDAEELISGALTQAVEARLQLARLERRGRGAKVSARNLELLRGMGEALRQLAASSDAFIRHAEGRASDELIRRLHPTEITNACDGLSHPERRAA